MQQIINLSKPTRINTESSRNWYELVANSLEILTGIDKKFNDGDLNEKSAYSARLIETQY